MENKTKGQIDEEGILASLPFDLQTMLYVYCLQKHLGQKVEGVLYNVIRRPGLRRKKTEQIEEFVDRIQDDVVKRPMHYFMRWRVEFLEEDIENWVSKSLDPILEQVMFFSVVALHPEQSFRALGFALTLSESFCVVHSLRTQQVL